MPKYHGAALINWAIINGDHTTGVTVIKMNEIMDAGEIINAQSMPMSDDDTAVTLRARMAQTSADLLVKTLQAIATKKFQLTKQDLSDVTYAPKLTKELGVINWKEDAAAIHNLVRGLLPWPGAFTFFEGKRLKILETGIGPKLTEKWQPGTIVEIKQEGLRIAAATKSSLLKSPPRGR